MIDFRDVVYHYPRQTVAALRDVSLSFDRGTFAVVAGQSGSGKSSLLRCPNGLIPHFYGGTFGGEVRVQGYDTRQLRTSQLSRRVGFVAQEPETQTVTDRVEDEIAFGPENLGLSTSEIQTRVSEMLAILNIEHLRAREIVTLSGGERQKVALAAALALYPSAIALDEPTSQLDPASAEEVIRALERLNRERGITVVVAEHRLQRLMATARELLELSGGTLASSGLLPGAAARLASPPPLVRLALELNLVPLPNVENIPSSWRELINGLRADPCWHPIPPSTACDAGVEFEHVSFSYGRHQVLRDVSMQIPEGRVTALMGRNGSGKTTLLKQINGLLRPEQGSVRVVGRDIVGKNTRQLAPTVAYLPQNPGALLFNDSVEDELRFTLRCRDARGDISGTLADLELTGLARRNPFDLSGGERQRAALAAVLVGDPRILLLDEPTRGMDTARKQELAALLRRLAGRGTTVLLATHDADLVADTADHVVILNAGTIAAAGDPRQVLAAHPLFAPDVSRVFGPGYLTVEDVLVAARNPAPS